MDDRDRELYLKGYREGWRDATTELRISVESEVAGLRQELRLLREQYERERRPMPEGQCPHPRRSNGGRCCLHDGSLIKVLYRFLQNQ